MNNAPSPRLAARLMGLAVLAATLAVAFPEPSSAQTQPAARNTRHALVIGIGDYLDPDVPPLKGIYAGGQSEGLGVSVEITQL